MGTRRRAGRPRSARSPASRGRRHHPRRRWSAGRAAALGDVLCAGCSSSAARPSSSKASRIASARASRSSTSEAAAAMPTPRRHAAGRPATQRAGRTCPRPAPADPVPPSAPPRAASFGRPRGRLLHTGAVRCRAPGWAPVTTPTAHRGVWARQRQLPPRPCFCRSRYGGRAARRIGVGLRGGRKVPAAVAALLGRSACLGWTWTPAYSTARRGGRMVGQGRPGGSDGFSGRSACR